MGELDGRALASDGNGARGSMTRRGFVGAAGVVAGVAAASGALAGGSREARAEETATQQPSFLTAPQSADEGQVVETVEADVLVVGAGVAGMSAARSAAEAGAKVVVVEKATGPQCRGNFGCQFGAIDSTYQRNQGIVLDKRAMVERFMRDTLQGANQFFIQYWADHSGETLDWCLAACPDAVELPLDATKDDIAALADGQVGVTGASDEPGYDPSEERYPAYNTNLRIKTNNTELFEGGFSDMLSYFQDIVEKAGGTFLFSTFARYLEKDNAGAVTGVIAQHQDGSYLRVKATSTILACGDFAGDEEMRSYYAPQAADLTCLFANTDCSGNITNTGDGHKMAMWAGAHMETAPYAPMSHLSSVNDVLIVNRKGERICNEDLGAQSVTDMILRQPGKVVYVVSGNSRGSVVLDPGPMGVVSDTPSDDFAELAAQIGDTCDPETLRATVESYNDMCAAGEDTQYGKAAKYMVELDAPYYVTQALPGNLLVMTGGIACDTNCQALDDDDQPIPGLFVVGNTMGGRFGAEYPMTIPGISHGSCFTLGRYVGARVVELAK